MLSVPIPLERSTPIIWIDPVTGDEWKMVVEGVLNADELNAWSVYGDADNDMPVCIRTEDTRVDTCEAAGFGYALTSVYQRHDLDFTYALAIAAEAGITPVAEVFIAMLNRWASGQTTDEDREILDAAICEVHHG